MDVFDLVAKLSLDKTDYDKGLDSAEEDAGGFSKKLKGAFGVAAKAGAGLAGGAVAAGTAIYGMATKSAATADHIDKMSQKLGLSREAYQEFDFVASQSGTSVDSMRGGLKTLTKQMTNAASGNKAATEAFEQLGLSVYDANGNLKDQETMMFETIEALQNMEDGTERASLATKLLGRSGAELTPLLNSGAGSLESMRQQARDLGLVLGDDVINAGVKFTDTVDQMQRAISAIGTEVGAEVMPIVQEALQFVVDHVPEIREVVSKVFSVLETYVTWFVNAIKTYVLPTIQSIVDFIRDVFAGDWDQAWKDIRNVITNAFDGITGFFGDLFTTVADWIKGIDWLSVGQTIWNAIVDAVSGIVGWATETFTNASQAIKDIDWIAVGNAIWDAIASAFDAIGDAFALIFQGGSDGAETGVDWVALGKAILDYVKSAFDAIGTVFTTIFNNAYTAITDIDWVALGQSIFDAIGKAFHSLASTFQKLFEGAKGFILDIDWIQLGQDIFDAIVEAFKSLASTFQKLFEGARDWVLKINWVKLGTDIFNAIGEAFADIASTFQKLFEGARDYILEIDWTQLGQDIFDAIGEAFMNVAGTFQALFEGARDYILKIDWVQLGHDMFDAIGEAFMNVAGTFQSIFEGARNWIRDNISWSGLGISIWESIKSGFTGILDFFTNLFDFSNIHIKLPHITVTWNDWGWVSTPSFGVEWYAKARNQPYMFSDATLFGAGEAGDEVLYGRGNLMNDIKEAVASANNSDRLYNLLYEYLPEILNNSSKEIVLDDGTLIGKIDSELGWGASAYRRGA